MNFVLYESKFKIKKKIFFWGEGGVEVGGGESKCFFFFQKVQI